MPVAKNIRYCRKQSGISQKDFASAIGVAQSTIHSWESKRTSVTVPYARKIAKYFGIDFEEFCDVDLERRDLELVGGTPLSIDEVQSLLKFRALPEATQAAIRAAIHAAYDVVSNNDATYSDSSNTS